MNSKNQQNLIVSLIKDDMINARLVNGLDALGLDAGDYLLHLSNTIFKLLNLPDPEQDEALFERYLELTKKAMKIDFHTEHEKLDELAQEVYAELNSACR